MKASNEQKLAIDGGAPVRTAAFPRWPVYGESEKNNLMEVLDSGKWGGAGLPFSPEYRPKTPQFEEKFCRLQGASHTVAVANGTVAITVALRALGVEPGDEVIVPPYTFIGTVSAVLAYGAIPVFADIQRDTLLINPESIEEAVTSRTRAILPVHLGGLACDLSRILEIARKRGLFVVEDAAQAVGAQWEGRGVGAIGDAGTFSFQSSKNLCAGEGGAIVTNSRETSEIAWSLANCGRIRSGEWYQHERVGQNYRMPEFQAGILLAQMARLGEQMQLRERNAALLAELLFGVEGVKMLRRDSRVTRHGWHLFCLTFDDESAERIEKRDFVRKVNAEGIPLSIGYAQSLNRNEAVTAAIKSLSRADRTQSCPVGEWAAEKGSMWLPQNVLLADEEAMRDVAHALVKVLESYR